MSDQIERIRALNDRLRTTFTGGGCVMTTGVAALGADAVRRLVKSITTFDEFCLANDPKEEHDFGSFSFDGVQVFFKIDYYDKQLQFASPDPSNPSVTERMITIMLAEEY